MTGADSTHAIPLASISLQVPALNALAVWLSHEQQLQQSHPGRVEALLLEPQGVAALVAMLESAGANKTSEQLLGPLLDMLGKAPALRVVRG